jgi:hypothetical protein
VFNSFKVIGLLASIALVTGCAVEAEPTAAEGEAVATVDQALGGVRVRTGTCDGDGFVIKEGTVYRLGVPVGPDVTNISLETGVCHNAANWQAGATFMCNANGGGTRADAIQPFYEYIGTTLVTHTAPTRADGLYFAYVDLTGPCPTRSQRDYGLGQVECCMEPATPVPAQP